MASASPRKGGTAARHARPRLESGAHMAVASMMRVFRACPVPGGRRLAGLPWIEISQSLGGQDSLVVGKNAGNFVESALFCENPSRKYLRSQSFEDGFPT